MSRTKELLLREVISLEKALLNLPEKEEGHSLYYGKTIHFTYDFKMECYKLHSLAFDEEIVFVEARGLAEFVILNIRLFL